MVAQPSKPVDPDVSVRVRCTAGGAWRGAVEIAPIAAFVVPFGLAFGAAASAKAVPPEIAVLMSGAIYAGASQFAP